MTAKDILALVNAGFTKEEIAKMDAGDAGAGDGAGENKPAGTDAGENLPKENEGAGKEQGAAGSEHESEIDKTIKALTDTVAGLTATVKAMQDANVKGASVSKPTTDKIKETMDSFIESL